MYTLVNQISSISWKKRCWKFWVRFSRSQIWSQSHSELESNSQEERGVQPKCLIQPLWQLPSRPLHSRCGAEGNLSPPSSSSYSSDSHQCPTNQCQSPVWWERAGRDSAEYSWTSTQTNLSVSQMWRSKVRLEKFQICPKSILKHSC